jgi:YHS domain-containing protein
MRFSTLALSAGLLLQGACASQPIKPDASGHVTQNVDPAGAVKGFDHHPKPGEKAICPVSGDVFIVTADTHVQEYDGKFYAFCCEDCPKNFHPELGSPMVGGGEHGD